MSNFNKYSEYYDLLYGDKDYSFESEYLYKHMTSDKELKSLLELGCGSGGHAEFFSKKGIDITGIDMSSSMIEIAKNSGATAIKFPADERSATPEGLLEVQAGSTPKIDNF